MKKLYKDISKGKSFFYYYGWTPLVFIGVFFLILFLIFKAMFYVKRTQRVELFIAAYGLKDNDYHNTIEKEFNDSGLIEFNIYSYMNDDVNTANYFSANGENADYVIFSESNIKDMEDYPYYNYRDVSTLTSECPSISQYDTYMYENTPIGIKVFDGKDESYNNSSTR